MQKMMLKPVGVLLLLLVLCAWESDCLLLSDPNHYQHTIYVDRCNPNRVDNNTCYTNSKQYPCQDINFALAFPERQNSTIFYLSSNCTHYLVNNETNNLFTGSTLVAFVGDNGTATIECGPHAGLAFINSTDIIIHGVEFFLCGAWRDSTSANLTSKSLKLISIRVGLYFYNCRNVNMSYVSVLNSTEAVGVVMYSVGGNNYIGHSHFDKNRISESNKNESGGGGFALEFNYCKPGDNNCGEHNHQTQNNNGSVYQFEYCTFNYNRGVDQSGKNQTDISILPRNETHVSLGRGGGFSLYIKGNATKNNISFSNCNFNNNQATWGGGMIIELVDSAMENLVSITYSDFTNNSCYNSDRSKGGPGGGVRIATFVYFPMKTNEDFKRNSIVIKWCTFTGNEALSGGAISLSFHRQSTHSKQLPQANVSDCNFDFNSARLGSAVSVDRDHYFTTGNLGTAYFRGCNYRNNTIVYADEAKPHSVGIGALYVSEIEVVFEDYNKFIQNNGTAVAVVGSTLTFSHYATALFQENLGSEGGALALLGMASIIMGSNSSINFTNNYASLFGGAIFNNYIGREDLSSSVKCFLQYYDPFCPPKQWLTYFTFNGNSAGKLGNSIFSTTILPCSWSDGTEILSDSAKNIFCWNNETWTYVNSSCDDQIRTLPQSFNLSNVRRHIFSGHSFQLKIDAKDDLGHIVTTDTIYTAAVISNNSSAKVDPKFSFIADGYVGILGTEEQNVTLKLNTARSRDWGFHLDLTIDKCPPGFVSRDLQSNISDESVAYIESDTACDCIGGKHIYSFAGNLLCDKSGLVSKIRNGYWIGIVPWIDNNTLYMATTNLLYKYTNKDFLFLNTSYKTLNYDQCSFLNRAGPLCGECREGYSTAVNSYDYRCVPCSRNNTNFGANIATYLALTYLPYGFVFIVITYFDIRLMSGPLIGFILFAQMIGSGVIDLTVNRLPYFKVEDVPHKLQRAYRIAYGLFNLNSFSEVMEPFCIRENFTALDTISLDYGVALFPLLPIFTVFFVVRFTDFKCCTKKTQKGIRNVTIARSRSQVYKTSKKSLLHPLVSFVYLSYAKFVLTSTKLLSTTRVFDKNGNAPSDIFPVYFAGQYYFGQREYILPYGLVAILLFIIFGALFPLIFLGPIDLINWLLDKPRFEKLGKFWPTLTVNHFMEAFHGCYKPQQKYFAGLYLMFRSIIFVIFAFSTNETSTRSWQLIFLIMILISVSYKKPYKVNFFTYLDIASLFNMTLINFISIYMYTSHSENENSDYQIAFYCIGVILIWLPMVYFVLFVCYLLFHNTQTYQNTAICLKVLITRLKNCWRVFCGEPIIEEERRPLLNPATRGTLYSADLTDDGLSDNDLFHRAEEPSRVSKAQKGRKSKKITEVVVVAEGMEGNANIHSTDVTASSGIVTGESSGTITSSVKSSDELL